MQAIPKNVTTLNLGGNNLFNGKSVDESVQIMQAIPKNVTTLNLSWNNFSESPVDKLVKIMQAIPKNVTTIDLSNNWFCNKPCDELVKIMQAIPEHVTTIDLKYNFLFVDKIPNAIDDDKILNALNHFDGKSSSKQSTPWKRNLIFPYYDNEETDFVRALLPMLSATRSLLKRKDTFFPFEITCEILSYLLPKLGSVPTEVVGDRICGFLSEPKLEEMATEAKNNPEGKEADTLKRLCLTQYSQYSGFKKP